MLLLSIGLCVGRKFWCIFILYILSYLYVYMLFSCAYTDHNLALPSQRCPLPTLFDSAPNAFLTSDFFCYLFYLFVLFAHLLWHLKCNGFAIGKTHQGFCPFPFTPVWSGSSRFWWISLITLFIFTSIKNLGTDTPHDDLWTIIFSVNKRMTFPSLCRISSFLQWRSF